MAIPIILPAQPAWPRVLVVLATVFFLWQAIGASGTPGAEDACHHLARLLTGSALLTLALYFASERLKPLFARHAALGALDLLFLLAYYASAVLLWAAAPLLVGRSEGLLNGRPLPRPVALAVVYAAGLAVYASRSLGAPRAASARAWLASLSGGAGLAAQALGVLLPGHALAARLQARHPHLPRALPHDLTLQGLEAFVGWEGAAALGALAAGAALQYALFTPVQTVAVLGEVVLDERVPVSAALRGGGGGGDAGGSAGGAGGRRAASRSASRGKAGASSSKSGAGGSSAAVGSSSSSSSSSSNSSSAGGGTARQRASRAALRA